MVTPATAHGTQLSSEQIGFLTAGPGRAAETALARLMDAGLVRVSRTGLVSAVHQNGHGATTPVETQILAHVRSAVRFDVVVQSAAYSTEMQALHQHLLDQRLMRRLRNRNARGWFYLVIAGLLFPIGLNAPVFFLGVPIALLIWYRLRGRGPVTNEGMAALQCATATDRVHAVALHGFRGTLNGRPVADHFGLSQSIVLMLPLRNRKKKSSSDGGSCGSGCGISGCGSGSSCSSGGSSCGGGGCGGGGGE